MLKTGRGQSFFKLKTRLLLRNPGSLDALGRTELALLSKVESELAEQDGTTLSELMSFNNSYFNIS